jgi:hypothetical protein
VKPLARLLVDLPNHWSSRRTEGLWARQVGEDLYELEDVPFFAYGLNRRDLVRTKRRSRLVREVVRWRGHTTFRMVFRDAGTPARHRSLLDELVAMKVSAATWTDDFFALDAPPDSDVDALHEHLERLEAEDLLGFETCEARRPGTFDG